MSFILKSAFCLAMVFLLLPEGEANRVKSEVARAVAQDKMVRSAMDRTTLAAERAMSDAERMCLKNSDECLGIAKQMVKNATDRF
ncbi:MAG: hypothetical protein Q8M31_13800 [Beijerinckiaceae bacterium]|nr:hypothetical protein [Beijerinckiaceae bacterium]